MITIINEAQVKMKSSDGIIRTTDNCYKLPSNSELIVYTDSIINNSFFKVKFSTNQLISFLSE